MKIYQGAALVVWVFLLCGAVNAAGQGNAAQRCEQGSIPRCIIEHYNDGSRVEIIIENETRILYKNILVFAESFAKVSVGEALVYINSLDNIAVAINQGSFARAYSIGTGTNWRITIRRAPRIIYE